MRFFHIPFFKTFFKKSKVIQFFCEGFNDSLAIVMFVFFLNGNLKVLIKRNAQTYDLL